MAMAPSSNCHSATNDGNRASSRINSLQINVQSLLHGGPLRSPMTRLSSPKIPRPGFLRSRLTHDEENVALTRPSVDRISQSATPTFGFERGFHTDGLASNGDANEPLARPRTNPSTWQSASLGGESTPATTTESDRQRAMKQRVKKRQKSAWVRNKADRPRFFSCIGKSSPRRKLIMCAVSGSILTIALTTYLGIALTSEKLGQPIHVVFILVILLVTVFFCHSLIRLCMHLLRSSSAVRNRNRIPSLSSPDGFNPDEPIRVHVVTDEEIAGAEDEDLRWARDSKGLVAPPPAYGLWRSSVRVNPNLLRWQRTQEPSTTEANAPAAQLSVENGIARPPSYLSDDGVEYVLRAEPRSIVPTAPISQAGNVDNASSSSTSMRNTAESTTQNVVQHPQDQHQTNQLLSPTNQFPITQASSVVPVPSPTAPPPPSPPSEAAAAVAAGAATTGMYTPYTSSSFYSEHTPPVVQAPDFGASLVEQMLLHPAYRA